MNTIKILSKLKNVEYLNRDHKIVLLILWDQLLSPNEKSSMSPKEIEMLGLYKSSKLQTTLKELVNMNFLDNTKGRYQITEMFLWVLGSITYTEYKEDDDINNIQNYTINKINEYLNGQLITNTMKNELNNSLKISSNQNKTILSYFREWFSEEEAHKKFNELNEYINKY